MKKIYCLLLMLVFIINKETSAQSNTSSQLSTRIADRLKDSLTLTSVQRDSIYQVNQRLALQKATIRQTVTGDSLRIRIQKIENTRDSLYKPILGEEKYLLYKSKKITLLNNN